MPLWTTKSKNTAKFDGVISIDSGASRRSTDCIRNEDPSGRGTTITSSTGCIFGGALPLLAGRRLDLRGLNRRVDFYIREQRRSRANTAH